MYPSSLNEYIDTTFIENGLVVFESINLKQINSKNIRNFLNEID